jgi:CheY-like chemotaxis protein
VEKILLVDDEPNVLAGFQRQLHKTHHIHTAISGAEGLKKIAEEGPYAVIVSDMRMPVMDGIAFLTEARKRAPESVRMMLTGNADQQTAIDAINRGAIFRFLNKPCSQENLTTALNAGLEQYRLVTAEKELLEKTLKGSISILMDILSLANPVAFSQATRLQHFATQIVQRLHLDAAWQYEIAALLAPVGFINVPAETIEKHLAGETLTALEKEMIASIPQITGMLLANIPRLFVVASMITQRDTVYATPLNFNNPDQTEMIRIGSNLLKVLTDFDIRLLRGHEPEEAIKEMTRNSNLYDAALLDMLKVVDLPRRQSIVRYVPIKDLRKGMVIDEDICNERGILVIPKGYKVNDMTCERLKNFLAKKEGAANVRVLTTAYAE